MRPFLLSKDHPKKRKVNFDDSPRSAPSGDESTLDTPREDSFDLLSPSPGEAKGTKTFFGDSEDEQDDNSFSANTTNDNEEEEEEEDLADELAEKMTKASISKKPAKVPMKVMHEHEIVYFEDEDHHQLIGITVRMPSGTIYSDLGCQLKMKGSSQYLSITTPIKAKFFTHEMAQASYIKIIGTTGRKWENFIHAKEKGLMELRAKHGAWGPGQEELMPAGSEEPILSEMELKLAFPCCDIGDEWVTNRKSDGHVLQRHDIFGETMYVEDKEYLTILTLVLVKKEQKKKVCKQTPQKGTNYQMDQFLTRPSNDGGGGKKKAV